MEKRYFITHISTGDLGVPKTGKKKLYFYTRIEGVPGEWYFGTDNNSFSKDQMDTRCKNGTVIALPEEVELKPQKGLWFNNKGEVFYGSLMPWKEPGHKWQLLFKSEKLLDLMR